ncbi:MAG: hypothetical protein ACYC0Q_15295, partial [Eubacteriales bacterium]
MKRTYADYRDKVVGEKEVVNIIKPGFRIFIEQDVGEPRAIMDSLMTNKDCIKDVTLIAAPFPNVNRLPFADPKFFGSWRILSFFGSRFVKDTPPDFFEYIPAYAS